MAWLISSSSVCFSSLLGFFIPRGRHANCQVGIAALAQSLHTAAATVETWNVRQRQRPKGFLTFNTFSAISSVWSINTQISLIICPQAVKGGKVSRSARRGCRVPYRKEKQLEFAREPGLSLLDVGHNHSRLCEYIAHILHLQGRDKESAAAKYRSTR